MGTWALNLTPRRAHHARPAGHAGGGGNRVVAVDGAAESAASEDCSLSCLTSVLSAISIMKSYSFTRSLPAGRAAERRRAVRGLDRRVGRPRYPGMSGLTGLLSSRVRV